MYYTIESFYSSNKTHAELNQERNFNPLTSEVE